TDGTLNRRCPVLHVLPHNVFIESGGSVARRGSARGAGTISWNIHPDMRRLSDGGDRDARCRKCHVRIVLLPDDRRQGYCFDFFALSQTRVALRRTSFSWSRSKRAVTRSLPLAQNGRSRLPRQRSPCLARIRLKDSLFFEYVSPGISKRKRMRRLARRPA